ncbi:stress response protein SCP2 [Williamsia limnetica]|uniref:Stress response protein SCP2 n=1 Tax=Williamsia limnetica TaxID=882452 RepID=A0A318RNG7_WILLI|nr:TerD family protein [Williamsia limnetica]PYE12965.1 stress response protein SCP2 [Williamsia limnetica]
MSISMTAGANSPLTSSEFRIEVSASGRRIDVSALLLTAAGKVRTDADLIFYNAPIGPGVRHVPGTASTPDAVVIAPASLPASIDKVVITASLDPPTTTFAGVQTVAGLIDIASGDHQVAFIPDNLTVETALVVFEVYRRGADWKVRAVGQGYANGLTGIATDFGITVDDEPTSAPPVTSPPAPSVPTPSVSAPSVPAYSGTAYSGTASADNRPNLDKGRVVLRKQQSVLLTKFGKPLQNKVRMALGWDPAPGRAKIDLDASCIAFDTTRKVVATCWFLKLSILDSAVAHSGDNLTGAGEGDDETITVDLGRLPTNVVGLVFTVNSFSGQKFTDVQRAFCRLVDVGTNEEMVRFELSDSNPSTGVLMCKMVREPSGWVMTALGQYADGKTVRKMKKPAAAAL